MVTFHDLVAKEMIKACKSGKSYKNWFEVYGLLLEEVEEFWEEVRKKSSKRDKLNALLELYQVATIAQKAAADLGAPVLDQGSTFASMCGRSRYTQLQRTENDIITSWHHASMELKDIMESLWTSIKKYSGTITLIDKLAELYSMCHLIAEDLGLLEHYNLGVEVVKASAEADMDLAELFKGVFDEATTGKARHKQGK